MEKDMQFKTIKVNELKPAEYNPRKDLQPTDPEYKKIKRSIEEFGYVEPIIVNYDNTIIGGHQRLKVLKDLGYKEIDVIQINISKTKEKALNVALNKISGEWDYDALERLLDELKDEDFDLGITGFDLDDVKVEPLPLELDEDEYEERDYQVKIKFLSVRDFKKVEEDLRLFLKENYDKISISVSGGYI